MMWIMKIPDEWIKFYQCWSYYAKANSTLVASFSNYGKKCNLFAPGDKIYTTTAGNSYAYDSGTSFSTYGFWNSSFDLVVLSKHS
jgi:hypothetical protein